MMLNVLDICTGIGGFSLALKYLVGGFQTVCYVEWDKYCQQVIQQRIKDGFLDDAPIWSDLKKFDGNPWRGVVDIITAGFPCQPFSVAGKQLGEADERNLWPDLARVIREVQPEYVFLENVPDLLRQYSSKVFGDLAASGYDLKWDCISGHSIGGHQVRRRVWVIATQSQINQQVLLYKNAVDVACDKKGMDEPRGRLPDINDQNSGSCAVSILGDAKRPAIPNGERSGINRRLSDGLVRYKALGNSVVPAVVAKAWEVLNEA